MYYRRNADSQLRSLERVLNMDYTLGNLLAYNQALLRAGEPVRVAHPTLVRLALEALGDQEDLGNDFNVQEIEGLQFPAFEVNIKYKTSSRDALLRSAIPLLLNLGWVALVRLRGVVELRIKKDREWGEYIVQWKENNKVNDDKSYHTGGLDADAKKDAEATMQHMLQSVPPHFITVPRSVMEPSGRPITEIAWDESPSGSILLADQWRRHEDPRSLIDPQYRGGYYPTAVLLVESANHDYVTWQDAVSYDVRRQVGSNLSYPHFDMTLERAKVDYLCRLLKLPCGDWESAFPSGRSLDSDNYQVYDS